MRIVKKLLVAAFWVAATVVALVRRDGATASRGASSEAGGGGQPTSGSAEVRPEPRRKKLRRRLWQAAGLIVLLAVGGFAVAASGIIPIKASSGHWAITAWFLNFSMGRSISTHSLGIKVPPLEEPHLVMKGAGHYETACRACHGSPELHQPRVAHAMTPHPPYLPPKIPQWDPEELFYLVKHGVKFTGMPAWPTQKRDDEVWAMVAFLRRYPELDAEEYRELARGEVVRRADAAPLTGMVEPSSVPPAVSESCGRCHGVDGNGRGEGAFPKLAGQPVEYLAATLEAYTDGARHSGIMEPIAAGLSPTAIQELAQYYRGRKRTATAAANAASAAQTARGESIARQGIPSQKVPACADCHGPAEFSLSDDYPRLAGQYSDYLILQLELFKKQHRGGTSYADLMHPVAEHLTQSQMRDVAAYYQSLTPD